MDLSAAHLHLVLNHIPVLGTMLFAPLVLLWGLVRGSRDGTQIGLLLTVLLAVTAIPIYLTGEPAEEQLENQPWFDKQRVEAHEERAEAGLIAVLVTGAVAVAGLWLARGGQPQRRSLTGVVLVGLLVSAVLFALAAIEGGQIRHDEIRAAAFAPQSMDSRST
ncbi:MAG TPA: hypothetical protein VHR41_07240 [Gemmatimonadales bacterium]|jgi:hypothetical protein|nr:hypothetical protein [Gemmatimonadales bacterium]